MKVLHFIIAMSELYGFDNVVNKTARIINPSTFNSTLIDPAGIQFQSQIVQGFPQNYLGPIGQALIDSPISIIAVNQSATGAELQINAPSVPGRDGHIKAIANTGVTAFSVYSANTSPSVNVVISPGQTAIGHWVAANQVWNLITETGTAVSQIIAGNGISVSPGGGTGNVTVSLSRPVTTFTNQFTLSAPTGFTQTGNLTWTVYSATDTLGHVVNSVKVDASANSITSTVASGPTTLTIPAASFPFLIQNLQVAVPFVSNGADSNATGMGTFDGSGNFQLWNLSSSAVPTNLFSTSGVGHIGFGSVTRFTFVYMQ